MNEYVTKAKVIEAIEKAVAPEIITIGDYETIGIFTRESIEQIVSNLPAADVAEVRHGRWEQHLQSSKVAPVYTCSLCKLNVSGFEKRWIKYCPYCGARMEKEDEHEAD